MVGVAEPDGANAVRLRTADRFVHGVGGEHLTHRIVAVDHRDGASIDNDLRLGDRVADAGPKAPTYHDRRITPCD